MSEKIPASAFPKIPVNQLMRIIEEWSLPKKNQRLPRRSLDARRLAMRLRHTQASIRNEPQMKASDCSDWMNVSDYLNACMEQNDFKTLEAFCEGFLEFAATAAPIAKGENGLLQALNCGNDPASSQVVAIARTILILQDRKGFPPYASEILAFLTDHRRGDDIQNISAADISKRLNELGLSNQLPKERANP